MNASLDLTIESALADPMVAATMRADRVDPRWLETLLTTTARRLADARGCDALPWGAMAGRPASKGSCAPW